MDSLQVVMQMNASELHNLHVMLGWQTGIVVGLAGIAMMFVLFVLAYSWYDRGLIERKVKAAAEALKLDIGSLERDLRRASDSAQRGNCFTAGELGRLAAGLQHARPSVAMQWHMWAACMYARGLYPISAREQLAKAAETHEAVGNVCKLDFGTLRSLADMLKEIPDVKEITDVKAELTTFFGVLSGEEKPPPAPNVVLLQPGVEKQPPPA
jgi:hypothetical protein